MNHVIHVVEGIDVPKDFIEITIQKGANAGKYAVQPKDGCTTCAGEPGFMIIREQGQKVKRPCNCVMRRLGMFFNKPGMSVPMTAPKKSAKGNGAKPPTQTGNPTVRHLRETISKMEGYIADKQRAVQELQAKQRADDAEAARRIAEAKDNVAALEQQRSELIASAEADIVIGKTNVDEAEAMAEAILREAQDRAMQVRNQAAYQFGVVREQADRKRERAAAMARSAAALDVPGMEARRAERAKEVDKEVNRLLDGHVRRYAYQIKQHQDRLAKLEAKTR